MLPLATEFYLVKCSMKDTVVLGVQVKATFVEHSEQLDRDKV